MADLHLVDFVLIPSPVRKEKQLSLPDDFSEFNFTIFSRTSQSAFRFPRFFEFSQRGQTAVQRTVLEMFYMTTAKQEISTFPLSQRQKSPLTSRCNVKGKIIGGIKGFLASKASILSTNTIVKVSLTVHLACS